MNYEARHLDLWPGWHLLGAYPDHEPDDVGSWLLHSDGEAALLEVPPGLRADDVREGLDRLGATLRLVTASHNHDDHLDEGAWRRVADAFPDALYVPPEAVQRNRQYGLGGEPLILLKAPKHSPEDLVTVFRGVAMTGDIELGTLASVNDEVPEPTKRNSMRRLRRFQVQYDYRVHTVVSAHLNDVREGVEWERLFEVT